MGLLTADSDPFMHMERNNKTYGFTIAVKELKETVPNIFRYASAYKRVNNITSQGLWEMFVEKKDDKKKGKGKLPKDDPKYKKPLPEEILKTEPGAGSLPDIDPDSMDGETYNMCHFWSNFEIARLDWFRSKEYNDFFEMMDRSGGFWMERVSSGACLVYAHIVLIIIVGRCTDSLPCRRGSLGPCRRPLFPRFWLPSHNDSALPCERTGAAAATFTIPRDDDIRRKEEKRRGRLLGVVGSGKGEWSWM
jgi:hypothetical protein